MSLPEQFGRYEVIRVLGQGAMGLVYKAVDPVIKRAVAVKVIQPDVGLSAADLERIRARFEQEFRSAGALSHSNIVTVFDVGKEGDFYYIAMEYVEGRSLDDVLEERRVLTFEELGRLAAELGAALDYAHGEGVVHRDIKPANVLLTLDGTAKITDFGLAKLEATTLTRTGALVGTPAYMSPEQVSGHSITGRSDQFSLAILIVSGVERRASVHRRQPPDADVQDHPRRAGVAAYREFVATRAGRQGDREGVGKGAGSAPPFMPRLCRVAEPRPRLPGEHYRCRRPDHRRGPRRGDDPR